MVVPSAAGEACLTPFSTANATAPPGSTPAPSLGMGDTVKVARDVVGSYLGAARRMSARAADPLASRPSTEAGGVSSHEPLSCHSVA